MLESDGIESSPGTNADSDDEDESNDSNTSDNAGEDDDADPLLDLGDHAQDDGGGGGDNVKDNDRGGSEVFREKRGSPAHFSGRWCQGVCCCRFAAVRSRWASKNRLLLLSACVVHVCMCAWTKYMRSHAQTP